MDPYRLPTKAAFAELLAPTNLQFGGGANRSDLVVQEPVHGSVSRQTSMIPK